MTGISIFLDKRVNSNPSILGIMISVMIRGGSVLLEEFPEPPPHYKLPEPDIRKRVSVISQTMSL